VGATPSAVAVGDFDSNGSTDLAVANYGYKSNLRILLNDGSGHFGLAPGSPFKVGSEPTSIAKADYNGDGKLDLAVASEKIRILIGDGTGRFSAAPGSPIQLAAAPVTLAPAELSGDGLPDLVALTLGDGGGYAFVILLNDGTGRFTALPGPTIAGKPYSVSFAVADFNGDGKQDLAVSAVDSSNLSIFPGNGAGAFGSPILVPAGKNPGEIGAGDFNGDGKPDLAVFVKRGLAILLDDGSSKFTPAPGSPLTSAANGYALAIADLSGDGRLDLAFADPDPATGAVVVLLGNGTGGFRRVPFSPFYAGWPGLVVAADLDADGRTDLLPLGNGIVWGPAPRGNMGLFQTPATPQIVRGRSLPAKVDAVFSTRKPISNLAADGKRAAICLSTDPVRLLVWTAPGHRSRRLTAECQDELAIAGGRVAWIEYYYGNTHRGYIVSVAKLSGGRPRQVESTEGDDIETEGGDDVGGPWVGQLIGGGPVLAYNSWWVECIPPPCDQECRDQGGGTGGCDSGNPTLRIAGQGLERIGARRPLRIRGGSSSYPLSAVGGGRIAVDPGTGVVVLAANGRRLAVIPPLKDDPPRAVALSKTHLAVLRTFALDLYNPATGAERRSLSLGRAAGLQLAGVSSRVALLRGPHELVLVRFSDGKLISLPLRPAAAKGLVDAKLTAAGLFYAYNLVRGATRGRIVFESAARLQARF